MSLQADQFTGPLPCSLGVGSRPSHGEGTSRPPCPCHEDRLEEQPREAGGVGVEAEGVVTIDPLAEVPGEDGDEEKSGDETDERSMSTHQEECEPESDLDDPGEHHDEVGVEGHPPGDLSEELGA